MAERSKRSHSATSEGLEQAKAKLRKFESKTVFADIVGVSRSTVQKFFAGIAVSQTSFKAICDALELTWEDVAGLEDTESSSIASNELMESLTEARQWRRSTVNPSYTVYERLIRFRQRASTWLENNSASLASESCSTTLNQTYPNLTNRQKKLFQRNVRYYLRLVMWCLEISDSTLYYDENMVNRLSPFEVDDYIRAFEYMNEHIRERESDLTHEAILEVEEELRHLLTYLRRLQ